MNGPIRAEKGSGKATLPARVLIDLRGLHRDDSQQSGFSVSHPSDNPETVGGSRDFPGYGVSVQEHIQ